MIRWREGGREIRMVGAAKTLKRDATIESEWARKRGIESSLALKKTYLEKRM